MSERSMKETHLESASLLAHELEAPLLTIELHLRKLLENPASRARAESCLDEVEALRGLVSELLATGKDEFARQPFSVDAVTKRLEARFQPVADQRGIRLEVQETNLNVLGDERATERVLSNLIDNGIKFSRPEGSVRVSGHASEGRAVIEVADDGPGVDNEDIAHLFEPFFRACRATPGHGLGLAIARRFAEGQEGTLTLESHGEAGARFVLRLESV
ncbi:MAG TPA: HAMP domain-containing sensor histidine kinase [Vicinamibacteria bacterium]|nr:HAMP domain-containing sensor histidine kinase [Vicinamibacteria bacterium]